MSGAEPPCSGRDSKSSRGRPSAGRGVGLEAAPPGHGLWVKEPGGPGGAYSYDGMFFVLFRVSATG